MTTDHVVGDPRRNRERMLSVDLHVSVDPESRVHRRRAVHLADDLGGAAVADEPAAHPLPESLLGHRGEGAFVKPPRFAVDGESISIGDDSVIGAGPVVTRGIPSNVAPVGDTARALGEIGPQSAVR